MGTDIYLHAERKIDGIWHQQYTPDDHSEWWYNGRSYRLFGLLAGVRGGNFQSLALPRGRPTDISDTLVEEGYACHTHSWYLLSELLHFKEQSTVQTGYLDIAG